MSSGGTGPTRRAVLCATATAGGAGLAGCLGAEVDLPAARPPEAGTWPLGRYGPRNTARTTTATPPHDPRVERVRTTTPATTVVVGGSGTGRRVLVGGFDDVTAHERDGAVAWRGPRADVAAVRPGSNRCYLVAGTELQCRRLTDGVLRWATDGRGGFAVVPSERGPFVPYNGGIAAYDQEGALRYRVQRGDGVGHAGVAIAEGVYLADVGMVERLAPRGPVRRFRGRPPPAMWRVEREPVFPTTPVVEDEEVYVTGERRGNETGVLSLTTDGAVRWSRSFRDYPTGAALGDDRLFVALDSDENARAGLYALDRRDGATDWARPTPDDPAVGYGDVVVAGGSLLVGGARAAGDGFVRALTPAGDPRWTRPVEHPVTDVAPVGDRVYAVTRGGGLHVVS